MATFTEYREPAWLREQREAERRAVKPARRCSCAPRAFCCHGVRPRATTTAAFVQGAVRDGNGNAGTVIAALAVGYVLGSRRR